MKNKKISIVIPVYNESDALEPLAEEINETFCDSGILYELDFVQFHNFLADARQS